MNGTIVALREELAGLRAEKEKLEEVAAEAEKGTAKGRSYEEEVAAAIDALALPLGDDAQAVGDQRESTGKKGDVVVSIGACHGPAQERDRLRGQGPAAEPPRPRCRSSTPAPGRAQRGLRRARRPDMTRSRRRCTRCASTTATSSSSPTTRRRPSGAAGRLLAGPGARRADGARRRRRHRRGGGHRHGRARGGGPRGRAAHPPAADRGQDADRQGVGDRGRDERAGAGIWRRSRRSCARGQPPRPCAAGVQQERPRPHAPAHPTLL